MLTHMKVVANSFFVGTILILNKNTIRNSHLVTHTTSQTFETGKLGGGHLQGPGYNDVHWQGLTN